MTVDNLEQKTDGELIAIYLQWRARAEAAMRVLYGRYHKKMHSRFLSKVSDGHIASDLVQELWHKVIRSLERYKDEGKFGHYLSVIASNVVNDYYRKKALHTGVFVSNGGRNADGDDQFFDSDDYPDQSQNVEQDAITDALMRHLIEVLVPALSVEQRTAWLLRHESEYWEPEQRLEWRHLAEMNGLSEAGAAQIFDSARKKLMTQSSSNAGSEGNNMLEEIELLVFLVWTQAQRLDKTQKFTWEDIAELLGQPAATMKTRYRSALKELSHGITAYTQGQMR